MATITDEDGEGEAEEREPMKFFFYDGSRLTRRSDRADRLSLSQRDVIRIMQVVRMRARQPWWLRLLPVRYWRFE